MSQVVYQPVQYTQTAYVPQVIQYQAPSEPNIQEIKSTSESKEDKTSISSTENKIDDKPDDKSEEKPVIPSKQKKSSAALIWAIVAIIIIVIVSIIIYEYYKKRKQTQTQQRESVDPTLNASLFNYGGVTNITDFPVSNAFHSPASELTQNTCTMSNNATWHNNRCYCHDRWFGNRCQLQKHPAKYISMGQVDLSNLEGDITNISPTQYLAFDSDSCATKCNESDMCKGFYFKDNNCSLVNSKITVNGDINYSFESPSNLFMKNSSDVMFKDKIYLSRIGFPNRYWLFTNNKYFTSFNIRTQVIINFVPTQAITNNRYGFYSNEPFDPNVFAEIYHLIESSNVLYIHKPNTELNIPTTMWGSELYVIYY